MPVDTNRMNVMLEPHLQRHASGVEAEIERRRETGNCKGNTYIIMTKYGIVTKILSVIILRQS